MKETETQKAIEQEAIEHVKHVGGNKACYDSYLAGHEAGRSKSLEEKEKEIERLKGLIKVEFFGRRSKLETSAQYELWKQFKTENQL